MSQIDGQPPILCWLSSAIGPPSYGAGYVPPRGKVSIENPEERDEVIIYHARPPYTLMYMIVG